MDSSLLSAIRTFIDTAVSSSAENHRFMIRLQELSNTVFTRLITYLVRRQLTLEEVKVTFDVSTGLALTDKNVVAYLDDYETGGHFTNVTAILTKFADDPGNVKRSYFANKTTIDATADDLKASYQQQFQSYQSSIIVYTSDVSIDERVLWFDRVLANSEIAAAIQAAANNPNATVRFPRIWEFVTSTFAVNYLTETTAAISSFKYSSFGSWLISCKYTVNNSDFLENAISEFANTTAITMGELNLTEADAEAIVSDELIQAWSDSWLLLKNQRTLDLIPNELSSFLAKYFYRFKFQGVNVGASTGTALLEIKDSVDSLIGWFEEITTIYQLIKHNLELIAEVNGIKHL